MSNKCSCQSFESPLLDHKFNLHHESKAAYALRVPTEKKKSWRVKSLIHSLTLLQGHHYKCHLIFHHCLVWLCKSADKSYSRASSSYRENDQLHFALCVHKLRAHERDQQHCLSPGMSFSSYNELLWSAQSFSTIICKVHHIYVFPSSSIYIMDYTWSLTAIIPI